MSAQTRLKIISSQSFDLPLVLARALACAHPLRASDPGAHRSLQPLTRARSSQICAGRLVSPLRAEPLG